MRLVMKIRVCEMRLFLSRSLVKMAGSVSATTISSRTVSSPMRFLLQAGGFGRSRDRHNRAQ